MHRLVARSSVRSWARPLAAATAVAAACSLVGATPADAGPADPPILAVSPANAAVVPAGGDGIPVVYSCPGNRHSIDDPIPFGTRADYGVAFTDSPATDPYGRLLDSNLVGLAGPDQVQDQDLPADTCRGYLTGTPAGTPGTYYWQARRICTFCPTGYDVSPVQSFTVTLAGSGVSLSVVTPKKIYQGIASLVQVRTPGLGSGAVVAVQGKVKGRWKTLGKGDVLGSRALVVVKPGAGLTALRATYTSGETVTSRERPVTVRRATSWPKAGAWQGRWAGDVSVSGQDGTSASFTVTGNRPPQVRRASFTVTLLCPTPGQVSPFTIQVVTVTLGKAVIGPDGRFVSAFAQRNQSALVFGRLNGSKVKGELHASLGPCAAGATISLRHR